MLRAVKRRLFPIVALLPAVAATLAALTLAVLLVVLPEATSLEFAPVNGAGVGTIDDGDLVVLEGADRAALAVGDVVETDLPELAGVEAEGFRLYRVTAVAGDAITLRGAEGGEETVLRAEIGRRVTHTIAGLGSTYDFVTSVAGWATIAVITVVMWALSGLLLRAWEWRTQLRRWETTVAAVPVALPSAPPSQAAAVRLPSTTELTSRPVVFPDQPAVAPVAMPASGFVPAQAPALTSGLVQLIGRPAPPHSPVLVPPRPVAQRPAPTFTPPVLPASGMMWRMEWTAVSVTATAVVVSLIASAAQRGQRAP